MAGHSKFKNIQHRKGAQDAKRAKVFTKLVREIYTAARMGQPDPNFNPRLRTAIITARSLSLPKDRIEAAIKKASSSNEAENYSEMRYEGYAPGGVALIVDALTDNKNRTASDVRSTFTKYGGNLGETGSVSFMFDHVGMIEYPNNIATEEEILEIAIDAGANDVSSDADSHIIYTEIESLGEVRDALITKFGDPLSARLSWNAKNKVLISDIDQATKLLKLVDILEDNDDVQYVSGNYEIDETIVDKISI